MPTGREKEAHAFKALQVPDCSGESRNGWIAWLELDFHQLNREIFICINAQLEIQIFNSVKG